MILCKFWSFKVPKIKQIFHNFIPEKHCFLYLPDSFVNSECCRVLECVRENKNSILSFQKHTMYLPDVFLNSECRQDLKYVKEKKKNIPNFPFLISTPMHYLFVIF